MKIDPHVHTSGVSLCSKIHYSDMIIQKKKAGYDGVVLTNHCQPWYYKEDERADWVQNFIAEYRACKRQGDSIGFKVFLGVEASVRVPHWSDFLIYGTDEQFFLKGPSLCRITQEELFNYCEEQGALMVQAHPFREGHSPANPKHMHGVEINLRPLDYEKRAMVEAFAKQHGLFVTCGSDYHSVDMTEFGGMILPDDICDSKALAKHLRQKGESTLFFEKEIATYKKG